MRLVKSNIVWVEFEFKNKTDKQLLCQYFRMKYIALEWNLCTKSYLTEL